MKDIRYAIAGFFLLLLSACTTHQSPYPDGDGEQGAGQVLIAFSAEPTVTTRTTLTGSDNLQHVTYVHLYIFKGNNSEARCIASENVEWMRPTGATASQIHWVRTRINYEEETVYTFLAVGLDCQRKDSEIEFTTGSAGTYNLPGAIQSGDGLSTGTKLSEAYARLADGKGQTDIATSELFAGYVQSKVKNDAGNWFTIDLHRRVAGVLGYFVNIPTGVANIKLIANTPQYTAVPLLRPKDDTADYGDENTDRFPETAGSEIVLDIPVTEEELLKEVLTADDGSTYTKYPGTVLKAVYMLPMRSLAGKSTFRLVTYDKDGAVLKAYKVKLEDKVTADFPIQANRFYSLGIKNKDTDEPIDLGGTDGKLIIRVDGSWQADVDIPM